MWWKWSWSDRLTKKKKTKTATAEAKEDGLELNMDDAMNLSSLEADGGSTTFIFTVRQQQNSLVMVHIVTEPS